MAVTVGTDSYVTSAVYIRFVADYYNVNLIADGNALDTPAIDSQLRQATLYLDNLYPWKGAKASNTQTLAFPRSGIGIDTVPENIKRAEMLIAYEIHTGALALNTGSSNAESQQTTSAAGGYSLPGGFRKVGASTTVRRSSSHLSSNPALLGDRHPLLEELLKDFIQGADAFVRSVRLRAQ